MFVIFFLSIYFRGGVHSGDVIFNVCSGLISATHTKTIVCLEESECVCVFFSSGVAEYWIIQHCFRCAIMSESGGGRKKGVFSFNFFADFYFCSIFSYNSRWRWISQGDLLMLGEFFLVAHAAAATTFLHTLAGQLPASLPSHQTGFLNCFWMSHELRQNFGFPQSTLSPTSINRTNQPHSNFGLSILFWHIIP